MRTLMLNLDGLPLSVVSMRRAIVLDMNNPNVTVLKYYDRNISSIDGKIKVPAVMIYSKYIKMNRKKSPSKRAIRLRDKNKCVYCNIELIADNFTIDHVVPVSRFLDKSSANTWENKVCCCKKCNSKKGNRTPEEANMKMLSKPHKMEILFLVENVPEEWQSYI
jgi:CRISPR/Cas system Type II protein with McrA/HNH and RuvC-like nuclease domain